MKLRDKQREKQLQAAQAKKEKLIAMEMASKTHKIKNQFEQEEEAQKEEIIERANALSREQMDLVKKMNQKVDYAKTVTIRDRQLDIKKT